VSGYNKKVQERQNIAITCTLDNPKEQTYTPYANTKIVISCPLHAIERKALRC